MKFHLVSETVVPGRRPRKLLHKRLGIRSVVLGVVFVLLSSTSRWGADSTLFAVLYPLGILLVGFATASRLWASVYHAGYKVNTLLTEGPYSMCRTPMYFCNALGAFGAALTSWTLSLPALLVAGLALYYPFVVRREEWSLRRQHGQVYEEYRRRTPAFLPDWRRLREPEKYTTRIRLFRRKMVDSCAPFAAVAVIHVIQTLHLHGLLPQLFQLY
jgi:protein-S-isoprenylcysteine O-methyltransferase Ste14